MLALLLAAALAGGPSAHDCRPTDPHGAVPADSPSFPVDDYAEPGWCGEGVDLAGRVAPDAPEPGQMVIDVPATGKTFVLLYRHGAFVPPPGWREMGRFPETAPPNGDFTEMMIQFYETKLVLVTSNPAWRVGNAICSTETGPMMVYLADAETASEDEAAARAFVRDLARSERVSSTLCTTALPAGDGYRLRFHDTRGRPGTDMEEAYADARMRFVPRGDFDAYRRVIR